jgi:RNA polymerase sigma-32 factor
MSEKCQKIIYSHPIRDRRTINKWLTKNKDKRINKPQKRQEGNMVVQTHTRDALQLYLNSIQHYKVLTFEEEQAYAKDWVKTGNKVAAEKLTKSHLRLVVKVALGFRGYGLPISEIIQEGNIGLMHAITRFDPEKGFRLSTYAMWWIRASIQEYVLNSWSLVKIGTTAAQKKLFFNLRKLRNKLKEISGNGLTPDGVDFIAEELGVRKKDVISMDQRMMTGDQSLNAVVSADIGSEWIDWLVNDEPNQEEVYSKNEVLLQRRHTLEEAMENLDEREREILHSRRLLDVDDTPTLEQLSQRFGISRERVRQLEMRAFDKVKKYMNRTFHAA